MIPDYGCPNCGLTGGHALRCPRGHGTRMKHEVSPSDAEDARVKFNRNMQAIYANPSIRLCDNCKGGGLQEDGFPCEECNGKGIK